MDAALIERLAREAGFSGPDDLGEAFETDPEGDEQKAAPDVWVYGEYFVGHAMARFAYLIAEECAKVADETKSDSLHFCNKAAAAIRAKFSPAD